MPIEESIKSITPMQWGLIAAAGIGAGILWRLHNKSTAATTAATTSTDSGLSAADSTALQSLLAGYAGTSPTASAVPSTGNETGSVSFTPGGSQFPVQFTGYTAPEVQSIIDKLIPTPAPSAPAPAPAPAAPIVNSPAPTPAPSPVAAAVQAVMDQGQYQASTGNPDALVAWINAGNVIAGSGPGGLSSRTQIAADINNRVSQGFISPQQGQQILGALPAYKGPA